MYDIWKDLSISCRSNPFFRHTLSASAVVMVTTTGAQYSLGDWESMRHVDVEWIRMKGMVDLTHPLHLLT